MIKSYELKVVLKGFEKIIYRKFAINSTLKIDDLCKAIIVSMNGDLEHLYELKHKNKFYICSYMDKSKYNEIKMNSLRVDKLLLDKNDKLTLYYDFGDGWEFLITVKKVIDDNYPKRISLLDGSGCGICEDCGGAWGLEDLIENEDNDWGYHVGNFDINEINAMLDKYYN